MPETTPLIKAALNLRAGAGFDVYDISALCELNKLEVLDITETNIRKLPENFPLKNLKNLELKEEIFDKIEDKEKLYNISDLTLDKLKGTERTGELLQAMDNLRCLSINNGAWGEEYSFEFLRNMDQIRKLSLGQSVGSEGYTPGETGVFASMKNLKGIEWKGVGGDDQTVEEILEEIGKAKQLNWIYMLVYMDGADLDLNHFSGLSELDNLDIVCDDSAKKIVGLENLQMISELTLQNPDKSLVEAASKLKNLTYFGIYNSELSDLNVLKDALKLRKIDVGWYCPNITLESMREVTQLEEVYFYPNTKENQIEELRKLQVQ